MDYSAFQSLWVILRAKSNGQWCQEGPWTANEVKDRLQKGLIRYGDYAWQKGLDRWVRVLDIKELSSHPERLPLDLSDDNKHEIFSPNSEPVDLSKIIEFKKGQLSILENPPAEAEGPDLVAESSTPRNP